MKRYLIVAPLLASCLLPLSACTSTTSSGAIGGERKQLLLVSDAQVQAMSAHAYQAELQEAAQRRLLDTNPAQVARLRRIVARLIPHTGVYRSDAPGWDWQVHTIKSNDINAYVMAGGKVMFYTGIIDRLGLTDDEIAAIMGHEMAHALREHTRERLSRQVATQGGLEIAGALLGLSQGQAQLAGLASEFGLNLPHNRTQESEADRLGLELMARAGYHPNASVTLWQKMMAVDGGRMPQFLSTHPNPDRRIQSLQALIPSVMPLYEATKR